ncbi:unnamed protein product, partial [Iphiclides podalirius]
MFVIEFSKFHIQRCLRRLAAAPSDETRSSVLYGHFLASTYKAACSSTFGLEDHLEGRLLSRDRIGYFQCGFKPGTQAQWGALTAPPCARHCRIKEQCT